MTRKDYIKIAEALHREREHTATLPTDERRVAGHELTRVTRAIGAVLYADNPHFIFERFYDAAGLYGLKE